MLYSELQEIKNLKTEEKYLNNILKKIDSHNKAYNTEYDVYSKEKISKTLKDVQQKRNTLIVELNKLLENAPISKKYKYAIKLYYIHNYSLNYIEADLSEKLNRNIVLNNFYRDIKDILYKNNI